MSDSLPPGWYPAPGSPPVLRWWDGIRWTGETRDADAGGDPGSATTAPGDTPEQAPGTRAAWLAPAVEAWETRAAGGPPKRPGRWLSRLRRR